MKNKKIISIAILFSFLLSSGCNINSNIPEITNESNINSNVPDITSVNNINGNSTNITQAKPSGNAAETSAVKSVTKPDDSVNTTKHTDSTTVTKINKEPVTEALESPETQASSAENESPVVTITTTSAAPAAPTEPSPPTIYSTAADGKLTFTNPYAVIDYSNTGDGYIMVKYTGSNSLVKVQVTNPNSSSQVYTINTNGNYEAIPLTGGDGKYTVMVCESVGTLFAPVNVGKFSVTLSDPLAPYLRPSNYVPFAYGDSAVVKSSQLCAGAKNDLEKVDRVYSWLVDNVTYDYNLASSVKPGYVADSEKVINKKIGICLDYAGTMAAMLRSQNVPVQVVVGKVSGTSSLHAWVNVYVTDVGWVCEAIYFDGSAWHRMDPTFAASSKSSDSIIQFIGSGSNYIAEKLY